MLIECTLPRHPNKSTRTIRHFGKDVTFKPVSATDLRLIAEVKDPGEAHRLANTPGYREFTDKVNTLPEPGSAPAPTPAPAPAAPVAPVPPAPAPMTAAQLREALAAAEKAEAEAEGSKTEPPADGNTSQPAAEVAQFSAEDQAAAEILLAGQPAQVVKRLGEPQPKSVLLAALALEKAASKPRASVLKALGVEA